MKKVFKILGITCLSAIVLLLSVAFVFGSTKHSNLIGNDEGKVKEYMEQFSKEEKFDGSVLVLHKGKVLLDQSYGLADKENKLPFQNDTLFPVGSITKSMTAVAILQLEEQGKLSISDLLSDYMPELPNANKITLHQLLNHSSGLADFLEVDEIQEDYTKAYSEKEIINSFKNKPLTSNPGEKYAYINSGYYLLGKIIEQVSGEAYSTYLQNHIFKSAGMNDTFVMNEGNVGKIQVKGYENGELIKNLHPSLLFACGDVVSTKTDLVKYISVIEKDRVLSEKQKSKMVTSNIDIVPYLAGYGYGWYVADSFLSFDEKEFWHGGSMPGLRSGLIRYPEKDLTIIIFSNKGSEWNYVELGNELASIILDKRMWFIHRLQ
ncbi:class A beta-lactamase-related serine hydrolase [Peribacillus asahii]|uniref:Class A beta-lactamase-related serine hydrolase n=1 Tax=Peribacillus asahii TaxID=228899 RepID=A0A398AYD1_9BACI|nr:serine hydrolase domain-containing protein [Peribacillus asahii]RID81718.1 class A beta-lactamase-related serine hydrolase [Peribacillus asahii]